MTCCSASAGHTFAVLFGRVYYRHLAVIATLAYLFIGMFIFSALEAPYEQQVTEAKQRHYLNSIETMTVDLANLSLNNETFVNWIILSVAAPDSSQPSKIVVKFLRANNSCFENDRNMKASPKKWDQPGAWLFSLTVLTTIGYGKLAPETAIGKLLCVVYASIGIPLLQIVLDHTRNLFIFMTILIEKQFTCSRYRGAHDTDQVNIENIESEHDNLLRYPKPWTLLVILLVHGIIVLIPSACFSYLEGWDYGTSIYYNFVTLSTIGFGDLIAGANVGGAGTRYHNEWQVSIYRIALSIWLLFGLTFALSVLQISRLQLERLLKFTTSWRCSLPCWQSESRDRESRPINRRPKDSSAVALEVYET